MVNKDESAEDIFKDADLRGVSHSDLLALASRAALTDAAAALWGTQALSEALTTLMTTGNPDALRTVTEALESAERASRAISRITRRAWEHQVRLVSGLKVRQQFSDIVQEETEKEDQGIDETLLQETPSGSWGKPVKGTEK